MTEIAETRAIKKLHTLVSNNGSSQEDIVNESIINGWSGLFPLKHTKLTMRPRPKQRPFEELFTND